MSKKMQRISYFWCCIRDMMKFMPLLFWGKLFASAAEGILQVWQPVLIAEIFQIAPNLYDGNITIFKRKILFLCICLGFPAACTILLRAVGLYGEGRNEKYYGWSMYRHAQKLPLEALEDKKVLDSFRKADAAYTRHLAGSRMFSYLLMNVESVLICVSTVIVVGRFSVWLLPGALLGMLPHLLLDILAEKRRSNTYRGQSARRRQLSYLWRLFCTKEPVKEMRVLGFQGYLKEKWVRANVDIVREMEALELKSIRLSAVGMLVKNCCYVANVAVALVLMLRGELAVGQFAACLTAFGLLQDRLFMLSSYVVSFIQSYHHVEEYYDFFRTEAEGEGGEAYHPFEKEIAMRDVHFRYPGADKDALDGVDLTIKKGEHVVIVGVNGSGKTTLSKVLLGVYRTASERVAFEGDCGNVDKSVLKGCKEDAYNAADHEHISGRVYYDGQDISKVRKDQLYRGSSLVQQDFIHYNFSLRENVGISDSRHMEDGERLQKVMEAAGMQELVQSIGDPDAQLGREFGGRELSGGEWQKVAVARGLFRDCDLIVLDEPTSALDPLVEYGILSGFLELIRGKTSIIISHRVGICRHADKVIVMRDGKIVECGSHEELRNAGGEYARIWREQAKWY